MNGSDWVVPGKKDKTRRKLLTEPVLEGFLLGNRVLTSSDFHLYQNDKMQDIDLAPAGNRKTANKTDNVGSNSGQVKVHDTFRDTGKDKKRTLATSPDYANDSVTDEEDRHGGKAVEKSKDKISQDFMIQVASKEFQPSPELAALLKNIQIIDEFYNEANVITPENPIVRMLTKELNSQLKKEESSDEDMGEGEEGEESE